MPDYTNHYLQKSPNAQYQPILCTEEEHFPVNRHILRIKALKCRLIGWCGDDFFKSLQLL